MRPTRITARDWMGFEELDLDLSGVSTVVITGENGAGKSALLDAMLWCLADKTTRKGLDSDDSLIRDGADSTLVSVEFTSPDGREATVDREKQRGRTGTLTLTVDGENRTRHKQSETLAAIADLMGMPYEGLMAGPVMAQESSGAFMRAQPRDRKDLLSSLLGLGRYAALTDRAAKAANARNADAKATAALADGMRPRLAAEPEHRAAKESATTTMYAAMEAESLASTRKDAAAAKIADARSRLAALDSAARDVAFHANSLARLDQTMARERERLAAAEAALATPEPGVAQGAEDVPDEALGAARAAVEAAERASRAHGLKAAEEAAIAGRIGRAQEARARVAGVPCGGVGEYAACQFLTSVPTEEQIAEDRRAREGVLIEAAGLASIASGYAEAKAEHERLRAQRQTALAERARVVTLRESRAVRMAEADRERAASTEAIDGLQTSIAETSAALERAKAGAGDTTTLRSELQALLADAEMAASAHTAAQAARQDAERRIAQADAALAAVAALRIEVENLDAGAKQAREDAATQTLLAQAFGRDGIPARILAETIPAIEAEANRVLDMLPGGMSLSLRTERTLADGRTADTLDVVVTDAGWERQYGLLSVGQRFRADLSIRIGIDRAVYGTRGGGGLLWLDEPLAALDKAGREAVVEAMGALDGYYGLLAVVSHHEEVNDAVPDRIDVTRQDGISRAVLA